MNSMFGEWYRQAEIEPQSVDLGHRWKGVESLKAKSDPEFAANLARLHFTLSDVPDSFIAELRKVFFEIDNNFRMINNDNELRVLSGAVLIEMIQRNDVFADGVSLVVQAAAFPELRKKTPLEDLLKAVKKHVFDRAIAVRALPAKTKAPPLADVEPTLNAMKTNIASGTTPTWAEVEALLRSLAENIAKVNQSAEGRINSSQRQQDILLEESNIIWWLFGGAVRETETQYSGLGAAEAALYAAKDLSSLTQVLPPPVASSVYLERALGNHAATSISLEDVAAVPSFKAVLPHANLFPLASCLASVDGGKTPKAAASAAAKAFQLRTGGVDAKVMSVQFFRESLAERFLHKKGQV